MPCGNLEQFCEELRALQTETFVKILSAILLGKLALKGKQSMEKLFILAIAEMHKFAIETFRLVWETSYHTSWKSRCNLDGIREVVGL